jgi:hypothetical protein
MVERLENPRELKIYGHTPLFYWWPVWAVGFVCALLTYAQGGGLAIVPFNSVFEASEHRIVLPPDQADSAIVQDLKEKGVHVRVHPSKSLGVVFAVVLFIVIIITNVPLRGLSSAIAISLILIITLLFAYMGWWEKVFEWFSFLKIFMNQGFYLTFSMALFVAWFLVVFVYDRFSYWRVTPGQITHEVVFGGGQKSFNTQGMAMEKLRDDLFRHWVLGFGSGDLIMNPIVPGGASREELQVHNVLFVGSKLKMIQELIDPDATQTRQ